MAWEKENHITAQKMRGARKKENHITAQKMRGARKKEEECIDHLRLCQKRARAPHRPIEKC
jgi:hypothetical protein